MASTRLKQWRLAPDMWRNLSSVNLQAIDWAYRSIGPKRLPASMFSRLYTFGLPAERVQQTLAAVSSLDTWSRAWVETAQHYLGQSRMELSAGNRMEAEKARNHAAMCYHAAQILELRSSVTRDRCRSWAARLYKLSLPYIHPDARHLQIPWRDQSLPVLFQAPEQGSGPFGVVILLNGVSMSKEETFLWAPRFLDAGYAVLALDSPGTGEATSMGPIDAGNTDILNGVFNLFANEPTLDLSRVFVVGASLGGNEAIRIVAKDRRILGVISVTPAVSPVRWMHRASAILKAELAELNGTDRGVSIAEAYEAMPAAESLNQPLLIFGAARDLVVPPNEAQRLAAHCGDGATLVWYEDLGHCLYAAIDQWTAQAAAWMGAVGEGSQHRITDAAELSALGREAVIHADVSPRVPDVDWSDDDDIEYARVIEQEREPR